MKDFEVSLNFIEDLIDLAKKKDVAKLKISYKDFKFLVDLKQPILNIPQAGFNMNQNIPNLEQKQQEKEEEVVEGNVVLSPIVGTFYIKPSPDKPDFIKVGDRVKKGDVLFIIESMKLMNEIKSEFDGVVLKILVEPGDGVEYGQPIVIIK